MNTGLLRKLYTMHKIKKKKLRWYKTPKHSDPDKARQALAKIKRELDKARRDGHRVVYIDEMCFSRRTLPDTEWTLPK